MKMKNEITISDIMKKAFDNDIKVYPDFNKVHQFAVIIEDNRNIIYQKKINPGEFKHTTETINKALIKALEYVYSKLVNNQ